MGYATFSVSAVMMLSIRLILKLSLQRFYGKYVSSAKNIFQSDYSFVRSNERFILTSTIGVDSSSIRH